MQDRPRLLEGFPAITKEEWVAQVKEDLKGADFDEKLVWRPEPGLEIQPFYAEEDRPAFAYLQKYEHAFANLSDGAYGLRKWLNVPLVTVGEDAQAANRKALHALENGADGVVFDLPEGGADFKALLAGVMLPHCSVTLRAPHARHLEAFLAQANEDVGRLSGGLIVTALAEARLSSRFARSKGNFRALSVAQPEGMSGAVESLAYFLAETVDALDTLTAEGVCPSEAAASMIYALRLSDKYFLEIARLRALRLLLCETVRLYEGGQGFAPSEIRLHAFTTVSKGEKAQADPYLNMISNTTQAMSAAIGGCDLLTVTPHNQGLEEVDGFAERIARNVSLILKEESYLDKAVDPAAGSYYVEALTDQLCEKAWERFRTAA